MSTGVKLMLTAPVTGVPLIVSSALAGNSNLALSAPVIAPPAPASSVCTAPLTSSVALKLALLAFEPSGNSRAANDDA